MDIEKLKKDIDYLFENKVELGSIGTKEQYCMYYESIFPETQYKNIAYHGTTVDFDEYKIGASNVGISSYGTLVDNFDFAKKWSVQRVEDRGGTAYVKLLKVNITDNEDGPYVDLYDDSTEEFPIKEIIFYRNEDVHLLGSSKDIEMFKNFIS